MLSIGLGIGLCLTGDMATNPKTSFLRPLARAVSESLTLVVTNRAGGTYTQDKEYIHGSRPVTRVRTCPVTHGTRGGAVILLVAFEQLRLSKCFDNLK